MMAPTGFEDPYTIKICQHIHMVALKLVMLESTAQLVTEYLPFVSKEKNKKVKDAQ